MNSWLNYDNSVRKSAGRFSIHDKKQEYPVRMFTIGAHRQCAEIHAETEKKGVLALRIHVSEKVTVERSGQHGEIVATLM